MATLIFYQREVNHHTLLDPSSIGFKHIFMNYQIYITKNIQYDKQINNRIRMKARLI